MSSVAFCSKVPPPFLEPVLRTPGAARPGMADDATAARVGLPVNRPEPDAEPPSAEPLPFWTVAIARRAYVPVDEGGDGSGLYLGWERWADHTAKMIARVPTNEIQAEMAVWAAVRAIMSGPVFARRVGSEVRRLRSVGGEFYQAGPR